MFGVQRFRSILTSFIAHVGDILFLVNGFMFLQRSELMPIDVPGWSAFSPLIVTMHGALPSHHNIENVMRLSLDFE